MLLSNINNVIRDPGRWQRNRGKVRLLLRPLLLQRPPSLTIKSVHYWHKVFIYEVIILQFGLSVPNFVSLVGFGLIKYNALCLLIKLCGTETIMYNQHCSVLIILQLPFLLNIVFVIYPCWKMC